MGIREDMPLLARNEGVWDGTYRHYDAGGRPLDEHRSRLICRFVEDAAEPYHQTNLYSWADGRREVRDFRATYRDKRVWFDNELITGWAAEIGLDQNARTMMLYWERAGDPGLYLYEMIQLSDDGQARCRIWHWIRNGRLETRTAIDETFVTADWRAVDRELHAAG